MSTEYAIYLRKSRADLEAEAAAVKAFVPA